MGRERDVFELGPGDVVLYLDDQCPAKHAEGINQTAFVVDERGALVLRNRRVELIPLNQIPLLRNVQVRKTDPKLGEAMASYFVRYERCPAHFEAGVRAGACRNFQPFELGSIFPVAPVYKNEGEYENAWQNFTFLLKPLDCILMTCRTSILSRFIAWATHGPWSHVALYVGDGEIAEWGTTGFRRGPIENYKGQQNWTACYRHIDTVKNPPSTAKARKAIESDPRNVPSGGYNYRGALWYGVRAFLGDHKLGLTPNSLIYQGLYVLIAQV